MLRKIIDGISAGILISIGGSVFLSCENKVIGAVLFSVALLCICHKGYSLFTGKVGYIPEKHGKEEISALLFGLLGNLIATSLCGFILSYALPKLKETAAVICDAKLEQSFFQALVRAVFCGILMYLAVSIFKEKQSVAGIFFCVPVFILSGFEHSIANMFYFSVAGIVSVKAFLYIWIIILGNTVGGMLLPILSHIGIDKESINGRKN